MWRPTLEQVGRQEDPQNIHRQGSWARQLLILNRPVLRKRPGAVGSGPPQLGLCAQARGGLDRVYVGMTGLHPVQRYLQHVTGYKASSVAKRFATALVYFESDMTSQEASDRERSLHQEYLDGGFDALGGH